MGEMRMKVECGDIVKTTWGILLVEKIKDDGTIIGHELKGMREFWSRNIDKDVEILNSDFRYKKHLNTSNTETENKEAD